VGAVDDALHDTGVVAQIDEREVLAVLPPSANPAAERDCLPLVLGPQLAAHVGAHRLG
jgi:hypothetical protein